MADDIVSEHVAISENDSEDYYKPEDNFNPKRIPQSEFNDIVRDLNLPKETAELLGSRLKNKNLLASGTHFSWYRHREKELISLFLQSDSLVYCNNINDLIHFYVIEHDLIEWRIFIDSSNRSFIALLLHKGIGPFLWTIQLKGKRH